MKTSRYTEAQILAILRQAEGGIAKRSPDSGPQPLCDFIVPLRLDLAQAAQDLRRGHVGDRLAAKVGIGHADEPFGFGKGGSGFAFLDIFGGTGSGL